MEPKQENPIISKIRKLMALSKSPNQHEAELAAQRCQDLLAEHNMSMAEIESIPNYTRTDKREKTAHKAAAMYQYQRDLMKAIAKNNFCFHWIEERFKPDPKGKPQWVDGREQRGRYAKAHMLLGREENVVGTQMMYDYLTETMDRLLPYQGMDKRGKDALLWLAGCTESLVDRLDEQRRQKEAETRRKSEEMAKSGETGLVRLSDVYQTEDDLNTDARYGYEPGTTARQRAESMARQHVCEMKEEELVLQGTDANDAWYVARGFNIPNKEAVVVVESKKETDAQRRKREEREARERAKRREKWDRQYHQEAARRNDPAYRGGKSTGQEISLNKQVKDRKPVGVLN